MKTPCVGDVDGRWRGFTGRVSGRCRSPAPCRIDRLLSCELFMWFEHETVGDPRRS